MVVSYFGFAWPVGIPLMFATALGLYGLWWGFVLGASVQDLSFGVFIARINWDREATKVCIQNTLTNHSVIESLRQFTKC